MFRQLWLAIEREGAMGSEGGGGKEAQSFLPQPGTSADLSPSEPLSVIYHSA